jgi:hypothetical protein
MDINEVIDMIIINQKDNIIKKNDFCCGRCNFNILVNVIETDKIKLIFRDNGECEVRRKINNNPVIVRDENKKIYRYHGEWCYLKYEMYKLAGLEKEANELLSNDFKYD